MFFYANLLANQRGIVYNPFRRAATRADKSPARHGAAQIIRGGEFPMKKLLLLSLALTLVFAFAACAQEDPAPVDEETVGDGTEVAG